MLYVMIHATSLPNDNAVIAALVECMSEHRCGATICNMPASHIQKGLHQAKYIDSVYLQMLSGTVSSQLHSLLFKATLELHDSMCTSIRQSVRTL